MHFFISTSAAILASILQFCSDNVHGDLVFANIESVPTYTCFKVRSSETRPNAPNERTKTNEENERARKRETDRGRDGIKDTAKRRKAGMVARTGKRAKEAG